MKTNMIIQDVATRWNSTLAMVKRFLQQKRAIKMYFARHEPPSEAENLSITDWKLIKSLANVLKPAEAMSLYLCKDESHLGLQIASAQMLGKELADVDVSELLAEKIQLQAYIKVNLAIWKKRNYGLALFLDPRFKDRRVADSSEFCRQVSQCILTQYRPVSSELNELSEFVESTQEEPARKKPRSLFAREKRTEVETLPTPNSWEINLSFELVTYNAEKTMPLLSDPLVYWQNNEVRFSILSKAARRYLSASSTSVASEQLFSHARDIFNYKRGQLDPKTAEQLIFLNRALDNVNFTY